MIFCIFVSLIMLIGFAASVTVKAENTDKKKDKMKVVSVDAGRKYFSVKQIKDIIDRASENGFTDLHLLLGNDALRFVLDDMSVSSGKTYQSKTIIDAIKKSNKIYFDRANSKITVSPEEQKNDSTCLTQTEMNEILDHAKNKKINVIPGINIPGHMDTILNVIAELKDFGDPYFQANGKTSKTTLSLENKAAVDFTKKLLAKYLAYFQSKGIKMFNFGADEYGNDVANDKGYEYILNHGSYKTFVDFVNGMVNQISDYGMKPMCFNDGIYYENETTYEFDRRLTVAYWTAGKTWWGDANPAHPNIFNAFGHDLLNVNQRWYYVLGRDDQGSYNLKDALANMANPKTKFDFVREGGSAEANSDRYNTVGSMICLWCDTPGMAYEPEKFFKYMDTFAKNNPEYFNKNGSEPSQNENNKLMKVISIDAGRKYFSPADLKKIITKASDKGYSHLHLLLGNDGLRFLLNDMAINVNGHNYTSENVKNAIIEANARYDSSDPAGRALSETEMIDIINFAKTKNISIIPGINTPGHMDAILMAMQKLGINNPNYVYEGKKSQTTLSFENKEAVEFTKALVKKYITFFNGKAEVFNFGADEYGNKVSGCRGFEDLQNKGLYSDFADYVNDLAQTILDAKMRPMCFNDGIYYKKYDKNIKFNQKIIISLWTAGFHYQGYQYSPADAEYLTAKGHDILNTNDDWYYVLGREYSGWYSFANAVKAMKTSKFTKTVGKQVKSIGSMICLWCDTPSARYKEDFLFRFIETFADNNPDVFKKVEPPVKKANYEKVDQAIALAKSKKAEGLYTEASIKKLDAEISKVVRDKPETEQAVVDGYATAIQAAIKALELKAADYSAVDAAIKRVPADLSKYTSETVAKVTEALNAVIRNKKVDEQAVVDGYAAAIQAAIKALELKAADYSAVDAAIKRVPADLSKYTPETAAKVTEALNAVIRNKKIDEQAVVDGYAQALEYAIAGLKLKNINYKMLEKTDPIQGEEAVFRSEADFSKFVSVAVDNKKLVLNEDYTVSSGSTVVTLTKKFTSGLRVGKHVITIVSQDGEAMSQFSVLVSQGKEEKQKDPDNTIIVKPDQKVNKVGKANKRIKTGDNRGIFGYLMLGLISVLAIVRLKRRSN